MPRRVQVSFEGWAAILFALARTGVCAYRAVTQSIVHDEALTYLNYVSGPWSNLYLFYDPNNHILFTILARLSIRILGMSEFSLRFVSVAAGFFLVLGVYRVLREAETPVAIRWAALLGIGLHPLLLDFSVAARGYSLAIACLIWAIAWSMRGRHVITGLLLGLGISANLVVLIPALALLVSRFGLSREAIPTRVRKLVTSGACMLVVFVTLCWGVLRSLTPDRFATVGVPTIYRSLDSMVMTSIRSTPNAGLFGTTEAAHFLQYVFIPVVMVLVAGAAFLMWRRGDQGHARLLAPATLGLACAGTITGHYILNLNYPVDRTGLVFVVLAGITWSIAVAEFKNRWVSSVNVIFALVLVAQFTTQFETTTFQIWWYDRSTKKAAQVLADECRGKPPASVRISATWFQQPALEFYRVYKHIDAIQPIERRDDIRLSGFDYYFLNAPDSQAPEARRMKVLFSDPRAGVVLADGVGRIR